MTGGPVSAPPRRGLLVVEGRSDEAAVHALARRLGHDLEAEGVAVEAIGGAHAIGRALRRFGPPFPFTVGGLYDAGEEGAVSRHLARIGVGTGAGREELAALGFHACDRDLEAELIRALGIERVEGVLAVEGDLDAFRTFQRQPAQREVPVEQQLRRFLGTKSGRKIRYGEVLVDALPIDAVPRPLTDALRHVRG